MLQRERLQQQLAQRTGQSLDFPIFKDVNQFPEGAIVAAERVNAVKIDQPLPAAATEIVLIQRIVIGEGRSAGCTVMICNQRLGGGKTGGTNRNSGRRGQWLLTDPAVVRKNNVYSAGS